MIKRRFNSLIIKVLVPVVIVGTFFSIILPKLLLPPIIQHLQSSADAAMKHTVDRAVSICEERTNYLLELRMEDNQEMDASSRKEAIEQIKSLGAIFPDMFTLIISKKGKIMGSSGSFIHEQTNFHSVNPGQMISGEFQDKNVKIFTRYFPYWQWYVVSMMFESDYMSPIQKTKTIIHLCSFGILFIVLTVLTILFTLRINHPIKLIIKGTEKIAKNDFKPIPVKGSDEISRVTQAVNTMANDLEKDQKKIRMILKDLQTSENQYRVLTESSIAYIAMLRNENFIFANNMVLTNLGYDLDQFIHMNAWEIVHKEDRDWVRNRVIELEKGLLNTDHFECRILTKEGKNLWFEILATRILFDDQNTILTHGINITNRKREEKVKLELEQQLARAKKMEAIGALAGGVAHDLNNILSAMVGYPDLLMAELSEDDPHREYVKVMQDSGKKAARIVEDMLTLARRGVPTTAVVNMNQILKNYLNSPEHQKLLSFHSKVSVKTDIEPGLFNIKGSEIHLFKTLMNLVSNAAESMPEGGTISITMKNQHVDRPFGNYDMINKGDYIVICVSDTGIGIAPEDLEKIFEPFYTKKVMGRSGTGLGMAVVWGTVKDHDGYINMQSHQGKGSTFWLYFPVTREPIPSQPNITSIKKLKGNNESILVVDDVQEQLEIMSKMLIKLGYTPRTVSSGEQAVAELKNMPADLIILDMIMEPGIDGLETFKQILEISPQQKAILASGYSETDRVKQALALGASTYIKKPYTIDILGVAIQQALYPEPS